MSQPAILPRDLRIVAIIFLVGGINSVLTMIIGAMANHISIEFGVFSIFAYFGLMRLSQGWRYYALIMSWLGILFAPVMVVVALSTNNCTFNIFNIPIARIPAVIVIIVALFFFCLSLWQLKVLTRPDIKALFRI